MGRQSTKKKDHDSFVVLFGEMEFGYLVAPFCIVINVGETHTIFFMLSRDGGVAHDPKILLADIIQLLHHDLTHLIGEGQRIEELQVTSLIVFYIHNAVDPCKLVQLLWTMLLGVFPCFPLEEVGLLLLAGRCDLH